MGMGLVKKIVQMQMANGLPRDEFEVAGTNLRVKILFRHGSQKYQEEPFVSGISVLSDGPSVASALPITSRGETRVELLLGRALLNHYRGRKGTRADGRKVRSKRLKTNLA